jgi:hypothetical protein
MNETMLIVRVRRYNKEVGRRGQRIKKGLTMSIIRRSEVIGGSIADKDKRVGVRASSVSGQILSRDWNTSLK